MSSNTTVLIFFSILSVVWALAHYYVARRLLAPTSFSKNQRRLVYAGLFHFWLITVVMTVVQRTSPGELSDLLSWPVLTYIGFFSTTFFLFLVRDSGFGIRNLVDRIRKREPDLERRAFLSRVSNGAALAIGGGLSAWGVTEALRKTAVERVEVTLPNLPSAFDGMTIAQISDLHIGPTIKGTWLRKIVGQVNGLNPDMIAVTGDLVDGSVARLSEDVRPLGDLSAPEGVYFVTGNHEYYSGAEDWCAFVGELGLTVLHNEHRVIERDGSRITLAGVTDFQADRVLETHRSDPAKAIEGAPEGAKILLAHQPRSAPAARDAGFDLQLSGHTHGGQFFPWNLFVGLVHPVAQGLGKVGELLVYVNRGTGYWGPPIRTAVPSEITLLTLRAG